MTDYVCGFMFDSSRVVLIRKNKPEFQRGKLNGVGGKIEPGETPAQAMAREFWEEAGVGTGAFEWHHRVTLTGRAGWRVHFFSMQGNEMLNMVRTMTDEQIEIHPLNPVPDDAMPNLRWILPLVQDRTGVSFPVEILDLSKAA